jgi:hypothetical protein
MSSMNTTTNLSNSDMNTEFMRYMKCAGAFVSPKDMTRYLAKQMKDKHSKSLAEPQGQGSMITKTQGAHLVRVRDTTVILSHKEQTRDEHGNTCVY